MRTKLLVFIILFFALSQISCAPKETYIKRALLMGTFIEIQIVPEKGIAKSDLDRAIESAFSEIRNAEKIFSQYDPQSELYHLNEEGTGRPYKVGKEFMFLLKKAKEVYELTEGAFDISVVPLEEMWQRASKANRIPSNSEVEDILNFIGMNRIIINEQNSTVELQKGMKLDFGAIAKGYAVDRAITSLGKNGIRRAIVNAGGDMYCLGEGLGGTGWQIGIRHPYRRTDYIATLIVKDRAVATSGSYERFYTIGGRRFSHIINPKTGVPMEEVPASVTVLAEDCVNADALATATFVLGPEKGMELLNKSEDIEGVIISGDLKKPKIEKSKGLREMMLYEEK